MLKSLIGTLLISLGNMSFANDITLDKRAHHHFDTIPISMYAGVRQTDSNVLVVLDGKVLGTIRELKNLDAIIKPQNIKSISIAKDSVATKLYGEKGKNGVIEIVSKKTDEKITDLKIEEVQENSDANITFQKVEIEATFKGGEKAWKAFLVKNLKAEVPVDRGAPEGIYTIILQFIVDKDGTISDLKTLTTHGFGMEEECLRLMKLSPNWEPAIQNGRIVKAYRKQPITFVISSE